MTKDINSDPYATHSPVLTAMLAATAGPVLELGCGNYSTPILHEMCKAMGRQLVSVESDYEWLNKFIAFRSENHLLCLCGERGNEWRFFISEEKTLTGMHWGLVFVDNDPVGQRKFDIEQLRGNTDYFVIHDTEPEVEHIYGFADILKTFKYRKDYTLLTPHTTVVSDNNPLNLDIFEQTK
jgi:hypothetical protein